VHNFTAHERLCLSLMCLHHARFFYASSPMIREDLGIFQFKRGSSHKILKVHDSFKLSSPLGEEDKLPLQVCTLQFKEYEIFTGLLSFVLLLKLARHGDKVM